MSKKFKRDVFKLADYDEFDEYEYNENNNSETKDDMTKQPIEDCLDKLVNNKIVKAKFKLKKFQKIAITVYDKNIIDQIVKECEFKDRGTIYDYAKYISFPMLTTWDMSTYGNKKSSRLVVSNKYECAMYYYIKEYYISCTIYVNIKYARKLIKIINTAIKSDGGGMFNNVDFTCKKGEYLEIGAVDKNSDNKTQRADIRTKKMPDENLVFDKHSEIIDVINDIKSFFSDEGYNRYKSLDVPYKRGVILYGDPGNGKSAMIRHIIRTVDNVAKIVINSSIGPYDITYVLSNLVKSLNGKKAIVTIEDIDSLITDENRSEFLNILDGVDIQTGVYFIGTTNYPDKIDPAFMNRSGRFDRTFYIGNPGKHTRELFFESRNMTKLFKQYPIFSNGKKSNNISKDIVKIFTKYSDDLPMASLKELVIGAAYSLATGKYSCLSKAVKEYSNMLKNNKNEHDKAFDRYQKKKKNKSKLKKLDSAYSYDECDDDEAMDIEPEEECRKISLKRL